MNSADLQAIFFNVNMLKHHQLVWDYVNSEADVLVFCGNPRFNLTEGTEYWDWKVWKHIESAAEHGVIIADLWAGAAHPAPLKPISVMAASILALKKTRNILAHEKKVTLKIARDKVAYEVMQTDSDDVFLLPCSSWRAKDFHKIEPAAKDVNCITPASLHIGSWEPLLPSINRLQLKLSQDKDTYVVVHELHEYRWIRDRCPDIEKLLCLYNRKDLLQFYARVDKLVSFRLHASVPALSLGAQLCHLHTDSRALTLEEFGVPSIPFDRIARDNFEPEFHAALGSESTAIQKFAEKFSPAIVQRIPANRNARMCEEALVIQFGHGLGDSANFAHSLPAYLRRGHKIKVHCSDDKRILYAPTGADVVTSSFSGARSHPWANPAPTTVFEPWSGNKAAENLSRRPMPDIGCVEDLWDEYCGESLDVTPHLSPTVLDNVNKFGSSVNLMAHFSR